MSFYAKVILDSIAPCGQRITTIECKYPRFIHSEIMTHRDRARNSASSRAIPWEKLVVCERDDPNWIKIEEGKFYKLADNCMKGMILNDPVVPIHWGAEQKGMQSGDEIPLELRDEAEKIWLEARDAAVGYASRLAFLGVHKSLCNRLTEPFMWITVVMTATQWKNFFKLRCHPAAERHFQKIAGMIQDAINESVPKYLLEGEWHLPYIQEGENNITLVDYFGLEKYLEIMHKYAYGMSCKEANVEIWKRISAARCARVSYLTHEGERKLTEDLKLFDRLMMRAEDSDDPPHSSPTEHVAQALSTHERSGCFVGWKQFRKEFKNECAD